MTIRLKSNPETSPSPNGYWHTKRDAMTAIRAFEKEAPILRGDLFVKETKVEGQL